MIKLLIFDFDGTIADTRNIYINSIYLFVRKLNYNFTKVQIENALGPKLRESLQNLGIKNEMHIKKIRDKVHEFIIKKAGKVKICADVKESLRKIKESNIKTALVTNSIGHFIDIILKKNGIKKYFNKILCAEDFTIKETAFKSLFRQFKVKPKETVYIADRILDVKIAKKVGCNYIIVLACSWDKKKFRNQSFLIDNMHDILVKL